MRPIYYTVGVFLSVALLAAALPIRLFPFGSRADVVVWDPVATATSYRIAVYSGPTTLATLNAPAGIGGVIVTDGGTRVVRVSAVNAQGIEGPLSAPLVLPP